MNQEDEMNQANPLAITIFVLLLLSTPARQLLSRRRAEELGESPIHLPKQTKTKTQKGPEALDLYKVCALTGELQVHTEPRKNTSSTYLLHLQLTWKVPYGRQVPRLAHKGLATELMSQIDLSSFELPGPS